MSDIYYIFYDIDFSCIAAIEYVIYKYGNEKWFNAALNKVVTDMYLKNSQEICQPPLVIRKKKDKKEFLLEHKGGLHYIICQMEKYKNTSNIPQDELLLFFIPTSPTLPKINLPPMH